MKIGIHYIFLVTIIVLILPTNPSVAMEPASFSAARSLIVDSPSQGNAYAAGFSIVHTANVDGDLTALGGSIVTTAPVSGDGFFSAGSIHSRAGIGGDLRAIGWSITIDEPIVGDLVALGFSVNNSSSASGSTFIIAANAVLSGGASGPVTVYGNEVSLAGDFNHDVDIVSSGRVTLAENTTIKGKLSYKAVEPATIPSSAVILGGVEYSNPSYLPDVGASRALAFISIGFFLFVRILGALILAGLFAGLFPKLAEMVVERAYTASPRSILLTMMLGFAAFVAAPVLFLLLTLTFVGIGLALLILITYAFVIFLSLIYAGILIGGLLARRYARRDAILWHDGVLGMLVLSLIALAPFVGLPMVFFLTIFSAGALLLIFFSFAFPHEERAPETL